MLKGVKFMKSFGEIMILNETAKYLNIVKSNPNLLKLIL